MNTAGIRWPSPLVLGGHSFIRELGNDPATEFDAQLDIVSRCLDAGITGFDTTYEPERAQLGRVLEELGRTNEADIIAWNFFAHPKTGEYLGAPQPYEPHHLELMLGQLRTDRIEFLVVHPVKDEAANRSQDEVVVSWLESGSAGALGTWAPGPDPAERFGAEDRYSFAVLSRNPAGPNTASLEACKALGWRTFATSPFGRGWLLDEFVELVTVDTGEDAGTARARLADAMLRYNLHCPHVDHTIVGIRKPEWIDADLAAVARGPLADEETAWLESLQRRAADR